MSPDMRSPQTCNAETPSNMPIRGRLEREKKRLSDRIADIDRALSLYDKNPDIEELTNLIGRI